MVELYSLEGKLLLHKIIPSNHNQFQIIQLPAELRGGIYVVQIMSGDSQSQQQILIE